MLKFNLGFECYALVQWPHYLELGKAFKVYVAVECDVVLLSLGFGRFAFAANFALLE